MESHPFFLEKNGWLNPAFSVYYLLTISTNKVRQCLVLNMLMPVKQKILHPVALPDEGLI
jgi:hypothetical protein